DNNRRFSPVHLAALRNEVGILEYLARRLRIEDFCSESKRDGTPIHLAVNQGNTESFRFLANLLPIEQIFALDGYNATALHAVAAGGYVEIFWILARKATHRQFKHVSNPGFTVLQILRSRNAKEVARVYKEVVIERERALFALLQKVAPGKNSSMVEA